MHRLVVAQPTAEGHVLIARIFPGTRVVATYDSQTVQDITDWVADLALIGMAVRFERNTGQSLAPAEEVEVAKVSVVGDGEQPTFIYAHPPTGAASEFDWVAAAELIAMGVASQITAGVAADAAGQEMPDTAAAA